MNSLYEEGSLAGNESGNGEARPARNHGDLQKNITMAQIARAAGVSQGAISSLLNDRDYGIRVSEKTRERVFKVCREMGYIPNDLRAVVRMYPEMGEFCLLIAAEIPGGISHPFVSRMAEAAMHSIRESSQPLTIATYEKGADYLADPERTPYPLGSGVTSKFLLYGEPNQSLFQQITRRGLPAISLGAEVALDGVFSIVPDFGAASRLAIQRLAQLGHERIAIVSGPFGSNEPRIIALHRGIKEAYDGLGRAVAAQHILYGDLQYESGRAALEEMLAHPVKPSAVFCLSDAAAAGVITQAQARNLQVPRDLSVVGCSDDCCSRMLLPGLTTVHIPAEAMAEAGVKEVERLVRSGEQIAPQSRILPVHLVERGSTALFTGR